MKTASLSAIRDAEYLAGKKNVPGGHTLMEKAAMLCADHIHSFKKSHKALAALPVVILSGKGNNGGDGILAGSYLSTKYHENVTIYSLQSPAMMSEEIRRHYCSLPPEAEIHFISSLSDVDIADKKVLIIDALLGIGFHGELHGIAKELISLINSSNNPVISVDIPSGIECDSGNGKDAVFADLTLTIGAEKRGLYISDGRIHSGCVKFLDIGFDLTNIAHTPDDFEVTHNIFDKIFLRRKEEFYKTKNGKLLIIGGSKSYPGAVVLSIHGANSTGIGLLTAAIKKRPFSEIPANVIVKDMCDGNECFCAADAGELSLLSEQNDCTVFGMGATANAHTSETVKILLQKAPLLLLDADALNSVALDPALWLAKKHNNIVITPHYQEALRLAKAFNIDDFTAKNRLEQAQSLAEKMQCTVVLKGDKTIIASPGLIPTVNPCGSYALAKGGSGDILSGVIGALLAREHGISIHEIATCGVKLHGAASDLAAGAKTAFNINDLPYFIQKYIDDNTIF